MLFKVLCVLGFLVAVDGVCLRCSRNEEYSRCGAHGCQSTCSRPTPEEGCKKNCTAGCVCKDGFVRNDYGVCIPLDDCASAEHKSVCPANEEYSKCGANGCQNTCEDPRLQEVCKGICVPGCICVEGYVKSNEGKCVLLKECDSVQVCETQKCPNFEVYSACGANKCQNTCQYPDLETECKGDCLAGCVCTEGYVRNEFNECVKQEECQRSQKYNY